MTENNSLVIEAGSDPQSLSYTPDAPEPKAAPEAKPLSSREALEKAASDLEAKGTKIGNDEEGEAPKPEPKPRAEGGKFAKAEAAPTEPENKAAAESEADQDPEANAEGEETGQEDGTKDRSSEDRDIDKPPARFLPRAKEKWAEVDADVRGEVHRALQNAEKGLQEHRESHEFRKELREFEDMAREHGTTVKAAMTNYVAIDNLLKTDPVAGINRVLTSIGITPQQYAQHILNAPQQPPADPEISQLKQTVQQLSQQLQQQQQVVQKRTQEEEYAEIDRTLFNEARQEYPRFDELRKDVAMFFESAKLADIEDVRDRLFAAVDMAERINPVGQYKQNTGRLNTATPVKPINPAGARSIKGAPNGTSVPKSANLGTKEAIDASMRALGF